MRTNRKIALFLLVLCVSVCFTACAERGDSTATHKKDIEIVAPDYGDQIGGKDNNQGDDHRIVDKDDEDDKKGKGKEIHYLRFLENNNVILSIVVLENETYEDLLPYFPTLTEEEGYIKYWDGDYTYTDYTHENQFQVYNADDTVIDIYAYMIKAE